MTTSVHAGGGARRSCPSHGPGANPSRATPNSSPIAANSTPTVSRRSAAGGSLFNFPYLSWLGSSRPRLDPRHRTRDLAKCRGPAQSREYVEPNFAQGLLGRLQRTRAASTALYAAIDCADCAATDCKSARAASAAHTERSRGVGGGSARARGRTDATVRRPAAVPASPPCKF